MQNYYFKEVSRCEMCGDTTEYHKILGQRLNKQQGYSPKKLTGISVSIQKCRRCNLIYATPQPIPYSLQDHYGKPPENYWKQNYFTWTPDYFMNQINAVKKLIYFTSGMKSLDIGAGIGKAMRTMEHAGFDAYGLEPSLTFYEKAISHMNIKKEKIKLGTIEDLNYEKNFFDFITFGAVFEHLYEPSKCLEKSLSWLKPNGIIHIEVPSSKWLVSKLINLFFRIAGTNYVTNLSPMHPPFHLYEFDVESFTELSKKLNFIVEKCNYDVCSVYHIPAVFHPILKSYMKATDTGMQITLYLRKNKSE